MASHWGRRTLVTTVCVASAWQLLGCGATQNQAPVEERGTGRPSVSHPVISATDASKVASAAAGTMPAVETRSPTYTVKPGDTMMRIGLDTGQSWRDIARWNNIVDPNVIEVGQVLRVLAPTSETTLVASGGAATVVPSPPPAAALTASAAAPTFKPLPPVGKTDPKAGDPRASAAVPSPVSSGTAAAGMSSGPQPSAIAPAATATSTPSAAPLTGAAAAPTALRDGDDELTWSWPAAGAVVVPFDDAKSKGLAIAGKAGDPVHAAADGRVVYAGSGLRGYGNLVIVKHNANYLTAYAHNQQLLVREDQIVKRGQKIAEMGATDADKVQLHFEIRRQGKPIDPSRLLPPR